MWGARARELGLDPRVGSDRVRPPFSPHRKNPAVCSTVDDPEGMLKALVRLGPPGPSRLTPIPRKGRSGSTGRVPSPRRRRPLPAWAVSAMKGEAIPDRYLDGDIVNRHRLDAGLAAACYLAGWSREKFITARLTKGTASAKALEMPRRKAERYLADKYDSAVTFVRENPPGRCPPDVYGTLLAVSDSAACCEFPRGKGYSLRKTIGAFVSKGIEIGRLEIGFSHRALAEVIGRSHSYVTRVILPTLIELGFLEVAQPGDGSAELGTVWRLKAPGLSHRSDPALGGHVLSGSLLRQAQHDAFDRRGFDASGYEVWALHAEPVTSAEALTRFRGSRATFYRRRSELLGAGALIMEPDGRIVQADAFDFDGYAEQSGSVAARRARTLRHELDREAYAACQERIRANLQVNLEKAWAELRGVGPLPVVATGTAAARDIVSDEDLTPSEAFDRLRLHAAARSAAVPPAPALAEPLHQDVGTAPVLKETAAMDWVADVLAEPARPPSMVGAER